MSRRKNRRNRRKDQRPAALDDVLARRLPPREASAAQEGAPDRDKIDAALPAPPEAAPGPLAARPSATDAWMRELHAGVERRRRRRGIVWSETLDMRNLLYMGIALVVAFLVFAVLRWMEWRDVAPGPGF